MFEAFPGESTRLAVSRIRVDVSVIRVGREGLAVQAKKSKCFTNVNSNPYSFAVSPLTGWLIL